MILRKQRSKTIEVKSVKQYFILDLLFSVAERCGVSTSVRSSQG